MLLSDHAPSTSTLAKLASLGDQVPANLTRSRSFSVGLTAVSFDPNSIELIIIQICVCLSNIWARENQTQPKKILELRK